MLLPEVRLAVSAITLPHGIPKIALRIELAYQGKSRISIYNIREIWICVEHQVHNIGMIAKVWRMKKTYSLCSLIQMLLAKTIALLYIESVDLQSATWFEITLLNQPD